MLKKISFILICFALLTHCIDKREKPDKPAGFINKEKLVPLLADLHIADVILGERKLHDREIPVKNASYYNSVFKKYNVKRNDFDSTMKYYSFHPKELEGIYKEVVTNLTLMRTKFPVDKVATK